MEPTLPCSGCDDPRLSTLRENGGGPARCLLRPARWGPRQIVFREGDEATTAYVVRSGLVRTYQALPEGRLQGLRLIGAGGLVGADGLAWPARRYTAETIGPTVLCAIPIVELRRRAGSSADLSRALLGFVADEVDGLLERLHELSLRRSDARVAAFFAALDPDAEAGSRELYQRDIAEFVGTTPETVCRVVAALRRRGVLDPRARDLRVRDRDTLKRLATQGA